MNKATSQIMFLLERYSSLEYFERLVAAWEQFVSFNEACVSRLSRNLPLDIRGRPLPEQGDVVWNTIVLPNIRRTSEALRNALHGIAHGDLTELAVANRVMNDAKGQQDYSQDWMTQSEQDDYADLLVTAQKLARNIAITEDAGWNACDLSTRYYANGRGPLDLPNVMPRYRINTSVSARTGMPVPVAGIYIPDIEHSDPQFLTTRKAAAPSTTVLVRLEEKRAPGGSIIGSDVVTSSNECTWNLIERVEKDSFAEMRTITSDWERIPALERCPRTGYYFSPAKPDSRRHFQTGELMPDLGSSYGRTIWQWDRDQ